MRILLLSDPESPHTVRWANALYDRGNEILLFGLSNFDPAPYNPGIKIESFNVFPFIKNKLHGNVLKIIYLLKLPLLKKVIRSFKPDILHSHYASSYGLMGALSGFHPFVVSVWGTDVYIFPNVSFIHRNFIKYILSKPDVICSTSNAMKKITESYTDKEIEIVPFGIDLNLFKPSSVALSNTNAEIVIGTVKRLEKESGIDKLIEAFYLLAKKLPDSTLKLIIIGGGTLYSVYKNLTKKYGIESKTIFTGVLTGEKVIEMHNSMDIEVYLSTYESFGVAVLEALACENPVVVSNIGGLPEIVDDGKTGFIIPNGNAVKAANVIEKLILDAELRKKIGKAGRQKVSEFFSWKENVDEMINIYNKIQEKRKF